MKDMLIHVTPTVRLCRLKYILALCERENKQRNTIPKALTEYLKLNVLFNILWVHLSAARSYGDITFHHGFVLTIITKKLNTNNLQWS